MLSGDCIPLLVKVATTGRSILVPPKTVAGSYSTSTPRRLSLASLMVELHETNQKTSSHSSKAHHAFGRPDGVLENGHFFSAPVPGVAAGVDAAELEVLPEDLPK